MVRFKNRFLLAELHWNDGRVDESLGEGAVLGLLRQGVALNFGDVCAGAALGSMALKYWNPTTGLAVLRCSRDIHREVLATLTLTRNIRGRSVAIRVVHNGSTLRSSQRAALEHSEGAFARLVGRGAVGEGTAAQGSKQAGRMINPCSRSSNEWCVIGR